MRIIAIAKRVLIELLRDKRTLALMFVAPILVLTLMKIVFTANSTVNLNVATVSVDSKVAQQLDDTKHVSVKKYDTKKKADKAIKDRKVDAIINFKDNNYYVTYANTDASKTSATKMALQSAMVTTNINNLKDTVTQLKDTLTKIQASLPPAAQAQMNRSSSNKNQAQKAPKIHNKYLYGDSDTNFFDKMLPILMGFFVFFFVFLISGMALLKERTTGTLDRLLSTPVKRSDIVYGYMISYGLLAVIQTLIIVLYTVWALDVQVTGSILLMILVNVLLAMVALAFGILMSTFAKSEFQMMQFIPLIIIPQIFFSGIIPLDTMADWIQYISYILPLKYAGDALSGIVLSGVNFSAIAVDLLVLLGFLVVLTYLNIVGLKRYRKV